MTLWILTSLVDAYKRTWWEKSHHAFLFSNVSRIPSIPLHTINTIIYPQHKSKTLAANKLFLTSKELVSNTKGNITT